MSVGELPSLAWACSYVGFPLVLECGENKPLGFVSMGKWREQSHFIPFLLTYAGGFSQCGFGDGKGGTHCSSSQAGRGQMVLASQKMLYLAVQYGKH